MKEIAPGGKYLEEVRMRGQWEYLYHFDDESFTSRSQPKKTIYFFIRLIAVFRNVGETEIWLQIKNFGNFWPGALWALCVGKSYATASKFSDSES